VDIIPTESYDTHSRSESVRRWGSSYSTALLDPRCLTFSVPSVEGVIGYRKENNCAVVFGEPVCPPESREILVKTFHQHCKEHGWRVIYLISSQEFRDWAFANHICRGSVHLTEELVINPQFDATVGSKGHLLRKKLNHSTGEGVSVQEYVDINPVLEKDIETVANIWLKGRKGLQIYLADFELFSDRKGKRWFYASQKGRVIGVLFLNQLEAHKGWLLNMQMAVPEAPNGTTEALVLKAVQILREEGCSYLTLGTALSENEGTFVGFGKISSWLGQSVLKGVRYFFPLDKRRKYWEKFQVKKEPTYQLFEKPQIGIKEIIGVMRIITTK
jgi:lysylphosphatidylglycerol synthetase-like protein (DUF2156 family)